MAAGIEHGRRPGQGPNGLQQHMVIRPGCRGSCRDDDVEAGRHVKRAETGPQTAFHAVPHDRAAHPLADREPEPRDRVVCPRHLEGQQSVAVAPPPPACLQEVGALPEADFPAHGASGPRSRERPLDREPGAAAGTPAAQDSSSADRSHAGAKAVHPRPASFLGLIGSFRHCVYRLEGDPVDYSRTAAPACRRGARKAVALTGPTAGSYNRGWWKQGFFAPPPPRGSVRRLRIHGREFKGYRSRRRSQP